MPLRMTLPFGMTMPLRMTMPFGMDGIRVLGVRDGQVDEHPDMRVVEAVERVPAVPPDRDHPVGAEQPEGVRGGGLAQPGDRGQIADAQLTVEQRDQQLQAARIAEQAEHVGRVDDVGLPGHPGVDTRNALRIHQPHVASVDALHICRSVHMSTVRAGVGRRNHRGYTDTQQDRKHQKQRLLGDQRTGQLPADHGSEVRSGWNRTSTPGVETPVAHS